MTVTEAKSEPTRNLSTEGDNQLVSLLEQPRQVLYGSLLLCQQLDCEQWRLSVYLLQLLHLELQLPCLHCVLCFRCCAVKRCLRHSLPGEAAFTETIACYFGLCAPALADEQEQQYIL